MDKSSLIPGALHILAGGYPCYTGIKDEVNSTIWMLIYKKEDSKKANSRTMTRGAKIRYWRL